MALSITFYNNVKYTKDDFMNRDRDFFGNGVVRATDFPLLFPAAPDMTFQIGSGVAWVDGYRIANDTASLPLTVAAASAQPRIDIVQIGHDDLNMEPVINLKMGVPATAPIEPGADAGFLKLYAISVAAGAISITADDVLDRRVLVPLNVTGAQINFAGAATTDTNTFSGTQTAPSFVATSQTTPLQLPNLAALPTVGASGTICIVNNQWYQSNGATWLAMYPAMQPATTSTLGGVKAGVGINVSTDGTIDINSTVLDPFRMDQLNFINLALEVETLKRAELNGVTENIFIESFVDLNDVSLLHGAYDATNQKVYLP